MPRTCSIPLLLALLFGCSQPPAPPAEPPYLPPPATPPLKVGDPLPPLVVEGWVNGPPPAPGAAGVKLLVVDVWGVWCPYCRQGSGNLARVAEKYAGRGVAFVSVTDSPRGSAEGYVRGRPAPWAAGYGAPPETVSAIGAASGNPQRGYAVAPVVYLVGPDGRVVWTDGQGRFRHVEAAEWERQLDAAIEKHLAATEARP